MPDVEVFRLPDVGEGLTEANIVTWHVKAGDNVAVNDTLVDVETAKSVVELPSPYAGVVIELHAAEGDTVPVGQPLVSIGTEEPVSDPPAQPTQPTTSEGENAPRIPDEEPTQTERKDAPDAPLILVGTGPKEVVPRRVHIRRPEGGSYDRRSPASMYSTGSTGRSAAPAETRTPIQGVRKVTAEAIERSAFTAPLAALWTTVDVTASLELVERLKRDRAWAGLRVDPLLLIARTVVLAVRAFPEINAYWDDEAQEIVVRRDLNLGVAAATPRGLIVPNIKDAGSMSMRDLAVGLEDAIRRARAGTLQPVDMSGGTITLTNIGTFGVEGATPILNPPEAAILALGAIQQRPWVIDGEVAVRHVMTVSMSIDHRVVDGELGAKVLRHVSMMLNDPSLALL